MIGPLDVGDKLAGYRITGVIGRGGMGVIYRGHNRKGEETALKVMLPELAGNPSFRERFLRELRYTAALHHPLIVEVRGGGEHGGLLYIAMQYIPGADLKAVLAVGPCRRWTPWRCSRRSPTRSTRPTPGGSSTVTSSPRTSSPSPGRPRRPAMLRDRLRPRQGHP